MRGVSIVVPAYNSSRTLNILTKRVFETMDNMDCDFELVLVNDGSADETWEVIRELVSTNDGIVGLDLLRNFGQHNALLCGIHFARFDTCITLDDDLQHPPEEMPKLLGKLDEGYDVVYGVPVSSQHGIARILGSVFLKWVGTIFFRIQRGTILSAFRVFRKDVIGGFRDWQGPSVSIDAILNWNTNNFAHIKVRHDRRHYGKSNYNIIKLLALSTTMLFGFNYGGPSNKPEGPPYIVREIVKKKPLHIRPRGEQHEI
jgi:glycosyltransferase involved in cell wall biosynthesis